MHANITRRRFLAGTVVAAAAFTVPWVVKSQKAFAFSQSPGLRKFAQDLRAIGGETGIDVAEPDVAPAPVTGAIHYSLSMAQFTDQLHPDLGSRTTLYGYTQPGVTTPTHLGGVIVAKKDVPIQLTFTNKLPAQHILPVDTSANFHDAQHFQNLGSTHLHGGLVPWISDGGPDSWFNPNGNYGPSTPQDFYKILNPHLMDGQAEYYYANHQSARMLWYHDHAHDLTRLNVYAGLASAYFIRDEFEMSLISRGLPEFFEDQGNEIPIIIQDKIFVGENILASDPTWPGSTAPGSLWYAHVYDPTRWTLTGPSASLPNPSVIPEFFGDTMLANGTVYPKVTVEARRYRLRILNACQARFLNLQLYVEDESQDGITLDSSFAPTNAKGPDFLVLGTEGGFLPNPVLVASNVPFNATTLGGSLITSPAERWDLLVDFSGFRGQSVIMYNDAPAPFPGGDTRNDYFPGAPGNATITQPGFGPDSRQIMRFDVVAATGVPDPTLEISPSTDLTAGNDPLPITLGDTALPPGVPVRRLTLNETADGYGRLLQLLGTDVPPGNPAQGFGRAYDDAPTEVVNAGTSEVWQIINLTADTHPIHVHLVNFQIISRQPFNVTNYNGGAPTFTGPAVPPDDDERGWKETVRANPGEVTNVIMTFNLPDVPFGVPASPRTGGNEYVWHCHILEHEEHDMMRPLVVTVAPTPTPTPSPIPTATPAPTPTATPAPIPTSFPKRPGLPKTGA